MPLPLIPDAALSAQLDHLLASAVYPGACFCQTEISVP